MGQGRVGRRDGADGCNRYTGDGFEPIIKARDPRTIPGFVKLTDGRITQTAALAAINRTIDVAGLIFYPGGKVQYESYSPLMKACAENGILCVLLHMPFNLAVLDADAANAIIGNYPEITDWYIWDHSSGGAMASSHAAHHSCELRGLILLAAHPTKELDGSGLRVLSVYGTKDGVMNMDKYTTAKEYFPDDIVDAVENRQKGGGRKWCVGRRRTQAGCRPSRTTTKSHAILSAELCPFSTASTIISAARN